MKTASSFTFTNVIRSDLHTPAWPGREKEDNNKRTYLGIKTADRLIKFESRSKGEKQFWLEGI